MIKIIFKNLPKHFANVDYSPLNELKPVFQLYKDIASVLKLPEKEIIILGQSSDPNTRLLLPEFMPDEETSYKTPSQEPPVEVYVAERNVNIAVDKLEKIIKGFLDGINLGSQASISYYPDSTPHMLL